MQEFLKSILFAVITAACPVLTAYLVALIRKLGDNAAANAESVKARTYITEAAKAIADAGAATNQTYVDALKSEGTFDEKAQVAAGGLVSYVATKRWFEDLDLQRQARAVFFCRGLFLHFGIQCVNIAAFAEKYNALCLFVLKMDGLNCRFQCKGTVLAERHIGQRAGGLLLCILAIAVILW